MIRISQTLTLNNALYVVKKSNKLVAVQVHKGYDTTQFMKLLANMK